MEEIFSVYLWIPGDLDIEGAYKADAFKKDFSIENLNKFIRSV